jgi:hypothetical protein
MFEASDTLKLFSNKNALQTRFSEHKRLGNRSGTIVNGKGPKNVSALIQ